MSSFPIFRLFLYLIFAATLVYIYVCSTVYREDIRRSIQSRAQINENLIYILQWTNLSSGSFLDTISKEELGFTRRNCQYTNCFVTSDRSLIGDYYNFDVIAFHGPEVVWMNKNQLPQIRSTHQKYVFTSLVTSDEFPVCSDMLNNFFNWTWTYKLNSDYRWGSIDVKDLNGSVIIGPADNVPWLKLEDMKPVTEKIASIFDDKTKTAAWFVSYCPTRSNRKTVFARLKKALKKYNLTVDVYGACGSIQCTKSDAECDKLVDKYYFYLAFEDFFCEDCLGENLLRALDHNAIPIVYGGANYIRFMPDGMYLNAGEIRSKHLAAKMNELINDKEKYLEYFKWKNHYSFHKRHASLFSHDYCDFCTLLNNKEKMKTTTIYADFQKWWDPPDRCYVELNTTVANNERYKTVADSELIATIADSRLNTNKVDSELKESVEDNGLNKNVADSEQKTTVADSELKESVADSGLIATVADSRLNTNIVDSELKDTVEDNGVNKNVADSKQKATVADSELNVFKVNSGPEATIADRGFKETVGDSGQETARDNGLEPTTAESLM